MRSTEHLQWLYDRFGPPGLANFSVSELEDGVIYRFGAFAVADHNGRVVLIRRKPIKKYPGIETVMLQPELDISSVRVSEYAERNSMRRKWLCRPVEGSSHRRRRSAFCGST
jgi:hypothetical protein